MGTIDQWGRSISGDDRVCYKRRAREGDLARCSSLGRIFDPLTENLEQARKVVDVAQHAQHNLRESNISCYVTLIPEQLSVFTESCVSSTI